MLDTGLGTFADPATQGLLPKSLAGAGLVAEDFADVLISHAHPDHIGGLVDKQGNQPFTQANIHISKTEFDFWQRATKEDFKKSPLYKMPEVLAHMIPGIQKVLTTIQPRVKFIDVQKRLYDLFTFQLAPGHTPGLTMTTITSKNEKLVAIADLIHSDALLFAHPEWTSSGDTDLQQVAASRVKILQKLAASKVRTFAYHLPWPGLGYVRPAGKAYEWVPEVFATP